MKTITLAVALLLTFSISEAKADLFYNSCVQSSSSKNMSDKDAEMYLDEQQLVDLNYSRNMGTMAMSCEKIEAIKNGAVVISFALMPAIKAMSAPGVQGALAAELAALGLAAGSPAVLAVGVLGSVGMATFYIIMTKTVNDCKKEKEAKLKADIINELTSKFRLQTNGNPSMQFVE